MKSKEIMKMVGESPLWRERIGRLKNACKGYYMNAGKMPPEELIQGKRDMIMLSVIKDDEKVFKAYLEMVYNDLGGGDVDNDLRGGDVDNG